MRPKRSRRGSRPFARQAESSQRSKWAEDAPFPSPFWVIPTGYGAIPESISAFKQDISVLYGLSDPFWGPEGANVPRDRFPWTLIRVAIAAGSLVVVLDIRESLIAGRGPFERAALFAGTP
jgi:hypothetical protein